MRIAYFHGLESLAYTEKNKFLHKNFVSVYDPPMNYKEDPKLFEKTLKYLQENPVDLLIGSSMGGWLAYCLSTHLGIDCLLFNPAVHSRSVDVSFTIGNAKSRSLVIVGANDDVITPSKTLQWFMDNPSSSRIIFLIDNFEHRVPQEIFEKFTIEITKRKLK